VADHIAPGFDYDVAVLGGGPGGYEAAIRCAQYSLKTVLIEARELGGTCLNRGCIPTKALLHGAEVYSGILSASAFGITVGECSMDFEKLSAFKDKQVEKLRRGIAALEKAHGVEVVNAFGRLTDANTIEAAGRRITAANIILATGSAPSLPPIPGIDAAGVMTSDDALAMRELPDSVVIIGGGVIGMEFATLFSAFGRKVTVLEMMPAILPGVDADITSSLNQTLTQRGVRIVTGARVDSIGNTGGGLCVAYTLGHEQDSASADCCLVSVGRRAQTAGIGLEETGVDMDRSFVRTDDHMRTNIGHIYAIGDITGKVQLAHVASAQGLIAAANCAGRDEIMRYDVIPTCIYTDPEIACVGLTEEKARAAGKNVKTGMFNVAGNGRALAMNAAQGFIKLVTEPSTGEILGAQILAPHATDMIAEIAAVMRCEGTVEELAATIHPHPTVSEIIMEAAHDAQGLCCHAVPPKRF